MQHQVWQHTTRRAALACVSLANATKNIDNSSCGCLKQLAAAEQQVDHHAACRSASDKELHTVRQGHLLVRWHNNTICCTLESVCACEHPVVCCMQTWDCVFMCTQGLPGLPVRYVFSTCMCHTHLGAVNRELGQQRAQHAFHIGNFICGRINAAAS